MEERDMPKADFVTAFVLIAFSIGVIWKSSLMPTFENRGANPLSAPGIVPAILGGIIGFLGIVMLVRAVRRGGHKLELSGEKLNGWLRKPATVRFGLTILLALIYAWGLVGNISYPLATFLFVTAFVIIFEYDRSKPLKKRRKTIIVALIEAALTAAVVSAVFRYVFLVNLP
jgi:hypothetical protein